MKDVFLVGSIGSLKAAAIMAGTFYALQDCGYNIKGMAGVSGSSIVTPLLAAGVKSHILSKIISDIPPGSLRDDDWLQQLVDKARNFKLFGIDFKRKGDKPYTGMLRGNGVEDACRDMYRAFSCNEFGTAHVPFIVVSTVIAREDESKAHPKLIDAMVDQVRLRSTSYVNDAEYIFDYTSTELVSEAVRGSIAIPGVFRPKFIEGIGTLVDGGTVNAIPILPLIERFGCRDVVVADATTEILTSPYAGKDIDNVVDTLIASAYAAVRSNTLERLVEAQEKLAAEKCRILHLHPKASIKMFETDRFPTVMGQVYCQTRSTITQEWGKLDATLSRK